MLTACGITEVWNDVAEQLSLYSGSCLSENPPTSAVIHNESFTAVLKSKPSDFVVVEVDPNGQWTSIVENKFIQDGSASAEASEYMFFAPPPTMRMLSPLSSSTCATAMSEDNADKDRAPDDENERGGEKEFSSAGSPLTTSGNSPISTLESSKCDVFLRDLLYDTEGTKSSFDDHENKEHKGREEEESVPYGFMSRRPLLKRLLTAVHETFGTTEQLFERIGGAAANTTSERWRRSKNGSHAAESVLATDALSSSSSSCSPSLPSFSAYDMKILLRQVLPASACPSTWRAPGSSSPSSWLQESIILPLTLPSSGELLHLSRYRLPKEERRGIHVLVRSQFPFLRSEVKEIVSDDNESDSGSLAMSCDKALPGTPIPSGTSSSVGSYYALVLSLDFGFVLTSFLLGRDAALWMANSSLSRLKAGSSIGLETVRADHQPMTHNTCPGGSIVMSENLHRQDCVKSDYHGRLCEDAEVIMTLRKEEEQVESVTTIKGKRQGSCDVVKLLRRAFHEVLRHSYPYIRCQVSNGIVSLKCTRPSGSTRAWTSLHDSRENPRLDCSASPELMAAAASGPGHIRPREEEISPRHEQENYHLETMRRMKVELEHPPFIGVASLDTAKSTPSTTTTTNNNNNTHHCSPLNNSPLDHPTEGGEKVNEEEDDPVTYFLSKCTGLTPRIPSSSPEAVRERSAASPLSVSCSVTTTTSTSTSTCLLPPSTVTEEGNGCCCSSIPEGRQPPSRDVPPHVRVHHSGATTSKSRFVYMIVKKVDVDTNEMKEIVGKHFAVPPQSVCLAGMKDKRAVTYQRVSIPLTAESAGQVEKIVHQLPFRIGFNSSPTNRERRQNDAGGIPSVEVLAFSSSPHFTQPVNIGELQGNAFDIVLRDVHVMVPEEGDFRVPQTTGAEDGLPSGNLSSSNTSTMSMVSKRTTTPLSILRHRLELAEKYGFINYFGQQRFSESVADISDHTGVYLIRQDWCNAVRSLYRAAPEFYAQFPREMDARFAPTSSRDMQLMTNALKLTYKSYFSEYILDSVHDVQAGSALWQQICETALQKISYGLRSMWVHAVQSVLFNECASRIVRRVRQWFVEYENVNATQICGETTTENKTNEEFMGEYTPSTRADCFLYWLRRLHIPLGDGQQGLEWTDSFIFQLTPEEKEELIAREAHPQSFQLGHSTECVCPSLKRADENPHTRTSSPLTRSVELTAFWNYWQIGMEVRRYLRSILILSLEETIRDVGIHPPLAPSHASGEEGEDNTRSNTQSTFMQLENKEKDSSVPPCTREEVSSPSKSTHPFIHALFSLRKVCGVPIATSQRKLLAFPTHTSLQSAPEKQSREAGMVSDSAEPLNIQTQFYLPSSCYATILLREIFRRDTFW